MTSVPKSWNSPKGFKVPNPSPPGEKPPRCACGGMFPLDTHPETGAKICARCYAQAIR